MPTLTVNRAAVRRKQAMLSDGLRKGGFTDAFTGDVLLNLPVPGQAPVPPLDAESTDLFARPLDYSDDKTRRWVMEQVDATLAAIGYDSAQLAGLTISCPPGGIHIHLPTGWSFTYTSDSERSSDGAIYAPTGHGLLAGLRLDAAGMMLKERLRRQEVVLNSIDDEGFQVTAKGCAEVFKRRLMPPQDGGVAERYWRWKDGELMFQSGVLLTEDLGLLPATRVPTPAAAAPPTAWRGPPGQKLRSSGAAQGSAPRRAAVRGPARATVETEFVAGVAATRVPPS